MAKQSKTVMITVDAAAKKRLGQAGNAVAELASALAFAADDCKSGKSSKK